jgi:hypothetical protein
MNAVVSILYIVPTVYLPPLNIKKKTQENLVTKSSHANDIVKMVTDFVESEFLAMGDRRRKIRVVSLEGRRRNVAVFELSGRAQFASWRCDGFSAEADTSSAADGG